MRITIDTDARTITRDHIDGCETLDLFSREAFEIISREWLRVGWNEKYPYTFSWLGRPIIQLPSDMIRAQEVIYRVKPTLIIETGVAHGGSLVFYASLCKTLGRGRVIGVDREIRPHNREALEAHELFGLITLIEGDAIGEDTLNQVRSLVKSDDAVLVILDSNHQEHHVLAELTAYSPLVTDGSYIVATDGSMSFLHDVPRGDETWQSDNPVAAVEKFLESHPCFALEDPPAWPFNESGLEQNVTHWPSAWLRKRAQ